MRSPPLKRILMIEDEPDIQAVAQLALEALGGFQVRVCSTGREGIQAAAAFDPDLILLDVMMPGMDGPSTLRALRAVPQRVSTPVVFMTAKVQPQEVAEYRAMGVLDVIAKPFDPMTLADTLLSIWDRHWVDMVASGSAALAEVFLAGLPDKLSAVDASWAQLRRYWDAEALTRLHRLVHSLHGTGATLGFEALSTAARELEHALVALDHIMSPSEQQCASIEQLIVGLKQAPHSRGEPSVAPPQPQVDEPVTIQDRLIWLLRLDPALAADLTTQLGYFGYHVQAYESLIEPLGQAGTSAPSAIITSADMLESERKAYQQAANGAAPRPLPPLIVISNQGDLASRLRAARAGAAAYFVWPVTTVALIDKLDALTSRSIEEPFRILIVDDDPVVATSFAETLRQAGMHTVVVTEPLQVMEPLAEFRPDLILMDMHMPSCNGLDLAAVIRQQEEYVGMPIVFLSVEASIEKQLEAMRLGGDDYILKPITPAHLISAVTSRVQRSRTLRSLMVRDSLTGLFNHTTTKENLEIELARAMRHQSPLSFAILDIDRFKLVNDSYGHTTGDRVLKSVARLLRDRLRQSDIIGRYGGEEFAVVLVGTDGPTAAMVLDQIRAGLAQIRQQADGEVFTVTFSCGIACFDDFADAPTLTEAADKALYIAKRSGRNQVTLASRDLLG
jgi:diguanylate cyclase (GGDEF)-like protein